MKLIHPTFFLVSTPPNNGVLTYKTDTLDRCIRAAKSLGDDTAVSMLERMQAAPAVRFGTSRRLRPWNTDMFSDLLGPGFVTGWNAIADFLDERLSGGSDPGSMFKVLMSCWEDTANSVIAPFENWSVNLIRQAEAHTRRSNGMLLPFSQKQGEIGKNTSYLTILNALLENKREIVENVWMQLWQTAVDERMQELLNHPDPLLHENFSRMADAGRALFEAGNHAMEEFSKAWMSAYFDAYGWFSDPKVKEQESPERKFLLLQRMRLLMLRSRWCTHMFRCDPMHLDSIWTSDNNLRARWTLDAIYIDDSAQAMSVSEWVHLGRILRTAPHAEHVTGNSVRNMYRSPVVFGRKVLEVLPEAVDVLADVAAEQGMEDIELLWQLKAAFPSTTMEKVEEEFEW